MNFIYKTWNLFFEKLYALALRQMNFGSASEYRTNGELHSLKQLALRWKGQPGPGRQPVNGSQPVAAGQPGSDRQPITLFDVGANVGEFTSEILEAFHGHQFQLYAFEPSTR